MNTILGAGRDGRGPAHALGRDPLLLSPGDGEARTQALLK